jgi:hypothetical protein
VAFLLLVDGQIVLGGLGWTRGNGWLGSLHPTLCDEAAKDGAPDFVASAGCRPFADRAKMRVSLRAKNTG